MLQKKIGKKAMLLGALAQSIPDIDFVSSFWNNTPNYLLAHRGFTHSLLFDVLVTILLASLANHYHKQHHIGYTKWILFFGSQISIHLFIDVFNSYGMGIFEPFSHKRFSLNALFVVDPFFSLGPAISFAALLILRPRAHKRIFWQRFGFLCCSIYLLYCSINKLKIDHDVKMLLKSENVPYKNYLTTPTPLNNWLWYVIAQNDSGFYAGYRSVFENKALPLHYFSQKKWLLQTVEDNEEIQHLIRFSQGFYTVEKWKDTLVFNDLRFGQIVGWYDPDQKFVFHYYLGKPGRANKLVVQRGRFSNWNWVTIKSLIRRIGNN